MHVRRWVKRTAFNLRLRYRQCAWQRRALPDFIIIGAQKSGTSSLFYYLSQHPQLVPSIKKEVHFFDGGTDPLIDNFEKGQAWYRAHFSLRKNIGLHQKTFEATPEYIFNPLAPRRMFDLIPKAKIIALLRNPTERAVSQYFQEKRRKHEPLPIRDAMQQEEKRLESVIRDKDYKNHIFVNNTYKCRGLYKEQLERYLNYFPLRQILVISSEEFLTDPRYILRRIFDFVEVDSGANVKDLRRRNVAKSRSAVGADVSEYLNNYFLPHNQALYELVGQNYGW